MVDLKNIKDYIARAVVFRQDFEKQLDLKDKFAKFTMMFPTIEDKMICKAIFDVKFTSDIAVRKFISQMIDGINSMVPQKMTEMLDLYNQVSALTYKQVQLDNKKISDDGGERSSVEEKQGTAVEDDRHGRAVDAFNVSNPVDPNRDLEKKDKSKKEKSADKSTITQISQDELKKVKMQIELSAKIKKAKEEQLKIDEAKKREAYERSLAERRHKQQYAKVSSEIQRILDHKDS